ncbi:MAG: Maf family protein [Coprobacillus cateniformis]
MNKIILASTSPRRKELLEREGIDFIVDASSIDETMDETLPIKERLCQLSKDKAEPIHHKYPQDIVIGADTIVYFQDCIIGKAKNREDAYQTIMMLSNQKHIVYTAVAIYNGNSLHTFCEKTEVYFKDISSMIDEYLDSGNGWGKWIIWYSRQSFCIC